MKIWYYWWRGGLRFVLGVIIRIERFESLKRLVRIYIEIYVRVFNINV